MEECETGPANDGRRINVASWVALHLVPYVLFGRERSLWRRDGEDEVGRRWRGNAP